MTETLPMNALESMCITYNKVGLKWQIAPAPRGAATFDKMLIIFGDPAARVVRQVMFYSTREGKFVGTF